MCEFPGLALTSKGWECPKCGRIWAPTYSGPCWCWQQKGITTTPNTQPIPYVGTPLPFPGTTTTGLGT